MGVELTTRVETIVPMNGPAAKLRLVRRSNDARLLPVRLQQRLLQLLVERRRLAPLRENQTPLVQYFYSGIGRYNGALMHRLTIQSKVVGPEGDAMFETRFVFDDKGDNVIVLN